MIARFFDFLQQLGGGPFRMHLLHASGKARYHRGSEGGALRVGVIAFTHGHYIVTTGHHIGFAATVGGGTERAVRFTNIQCVHRAH